MLAISVAPNRQVKRLKRKGLKLEKYSGVLRKRMTEPKTPGERPPGVQSLHQTKNGNHERQFIQNLIRVNMDAVDGVGRRIAKMPHIGPSTNFQYPAGYYASLPSHAPIVNRQRYVKYSEDLRGAFEKVESTGELVWVAYWGGRYPGAIRELSVVDVQHGQIDAIDAAAGDKRSYYFSRMIWVVFDSGLKVLNPSEPVPKFPNLIDYVENYAKELINLGWTLIYDEAENDLKVFERRTRMPEIRTEPDFWVRRNMGQHSESDPWKVTYRGFGEDRWQDTVDRRFLSQVMEHAIHWLRSRSPARPNLGPYVTFDRD